MSCVTPYICLNSQCSQSTFVRCVNSTCLSLFNNCLDDTLNYACVNSCQFNCSCALHDLTGFIAYSVVMLLVVVFPVIAVNTAILVALALESSIVKVIRLVLASSLISGLLSALGLIMFHIAEIVLSYYFPMNDPPSQPCTIPLFLVSVGGAARSVFMATFAIVVYIIIKHGNATKKRLVVTVLVAVVVLWGITFLVTSPLFSQQVISTDYWLVDTQYYCHPIIGPCEQSAYIFWGMSLFFFGVVTPSVAVVFLLIICCNRRSFTSATAVEKTLVKFGFFLLLGSRLNMIGLMVPFVIVITGDHYIFVDGAYNHERLNMLIYASTTFVNAGLIPTPILILIFFKSIRRRMLRWLCCCMAKKRKAKCNHNNNNNNNNNNSNVEGCMVTTGV